MKIRTFITCSDIDVDKNTGDLIVKDMFYSLASKKFPYEDIIVIVLTFDEVEEKPKKLEMALLDGRDKPALDFKARDLAPLCNAVVFKLKIKIPKPDKYSIKLSYDGTFLGKYPLNIKQIGDENE
jgi:hypothetical protein